MVAKNLIEDMIIEQASPTLAGIKTGSLFTVKHMSSDDLTAETKRLNELLNQKGIIVTILKTTEKFSLMYVYKKNLLSNDLHNSKAVEILTEYGYDISNVDAMVENLAIRMNTSEEFPHEIGLFLGYPIDDVIGFICHKGQNCNLCGYWKVYKDTQGALKKFAEFDRCRQLYKLLWSEGKDLLLLTAL